MHQKTSALPSVETLKHQLNNLQIRHIGWQQAQELMAAKLAPHFSPFNIYRNQEIDVSRHLALLLDPRGAHGQGSLFWDAWAELVISAQGNQHLLISEGEAEAEGENLITSREKHGSHISQSATTSQMQTAWLEHSFVKEVNTEHPTSSLERNRYIDLLIHLQAPNGLMAIENKPWNSSVDEKDQLSDYATHLTQIAKGSPWVLVYLGQGLPSEESITSPRREELIKRGNLVCVPWTQALQMLRQCAPKIQASKVRWFVEDFIEMLEAETMNYIDEKEMLHVAEAFNTSAQALQQAILLRDTLRQWQSSRLKLLKELLNKRFAEEGVTPEWGINPDLPHKKMAHFTLPFADYPEEFLCFEWYRGFSDEEHFYWGLYTEKLGEDTAKRLAHTLAKAAPHLPPSEEVEANWPFWVYLKNDPLFTPDAKHNDAAAVHPWLSIDRKENDFVTLVLQRYREMKTILQSNFEQANFK